MRDQVRPCGADKDNMHVVKNIQEMREDYGSTI